MTNKETKIQPQTVFVNKGQETQTDELSQRIRAAENPKNGWMIKVKAKMPSTLAS